MAFGFVLIFILILVNLKNYLMNCLTQNEDYNQLNSMSIEKNFELTNRAFEALIDEFFKKYNKFL